MDFFEAINIEKKYGDFTALSDVSISVPEGSIYGLLGPNGAGKTTLIRIINRFFAPDKGRLIYKGQEMTKDDVFDIGYLPEERGLYKKMRVGEQLFYLARLKGLSRADAIKQIKYWMEKFEIQDWYNKRVEALSKGMAQKLQFIITVLHNPGLLIFDEPFSGFDPINATMLKNEILDLRAKGATVIFSTHDMSSVEELCDNITLVNKSKSILEGEVHEIKNRYKADVYEVSFAGDFDKVRNIISSKYNIVEHRVERDINYVRLKLVHPDGDNEILSLIMPHVRIISFNEVFPTMNDIFIRVVESSNRN
jgi:ABC-2 type transport system ATP-binding protein